MSAEPAGRPRLGWPTMLLYGMGSIANTTKARGLSGFLMIFYNQALGLDARLVGLGTSIALIFDAIVDPTIGQISDNVRTPWGRRHPFMYAATLPVAIAFFLLWNPPVGWEGAQLFGYMLACLLSIRLFDTFFELPSAALLPELVTDYHKRTTLISIRSLFGVVGGLGVTILALNVLMPDTHGRGGVLARDGYLNYSIFAAGLIIAMILISTMATHKFIPWLRKAPEKTSAPAVMAREVLETVKNRGFMVATLSGVFTALALAITQGLEFYFNLFFWGFNQGQISLMLTVQAVGAMLGLLGTPLWSRWLGKKMGAIGAYAIALAVGITPITLRLLHVMPPNGTTELFLAVALEKFINAGFATMTGVLLASMIADVVEDVEVRTGRRSEGLLFSADSLFKKTTSAAGPSIAGLIIWLVALPADARRTGVAPDVLHNLALVYLPSVVVLYIAAILCLFLFPISKAVHENNLRILAEGAAVYDADQTPQAVTGAL